jgi:hypothetical protein
MRRSPLFALLALAVSACASSSSAPAAGAGAAAAAPAPAGNPAPCTEGGCRIVINVPEDVRPEFARRQASYRVYEGCPRQIGSLQNAKTLTTSTTPNIAIPSGNSRIVTVAVAFGPTIQRSVTIDLGAQALQTVDFGYTWEGSQLGTDQTIRLRSADVERRICR